MTRSLFAPILWAFFSLPLHAGSVEFAQWIPWDFVSQELRKNEFVTDVSRTEMSLNVGELKPVLTGVSVYSRARVTDFIPDDKGVQISAEGSLSIRIGSLSIDQLIEREFGGNVIQVRLKATCSSVNIGINAFGIQSAFGIGAAGNNLPSLEDIELVFSSRNWQVSPISCTGLGGIGQEIENAISAGLSDPAALSMMLKNWLAPWFEEWIRNSWLAVNDSDGEWKNLSIHKPGINGFYLKGELPLESQQDILLPSTLPVDPDLSTPRFYLSREGWVAIAEDKIKKFIPVSYDLRGNENFRKLMQSRLMQFFVWPHLRRFHPSTPFVLKIDPSSVGLNLVEGRGKWDATVTGSGSLTTLVGGAPIDYLIFKTKLSVPLSMTLENGELILKSGKTTASLEWKFGYLYELLYSPDKKIPVQIMTGALTGLTSDKKQILKLPSFRIGDKEYVLGNLRAEDQLFTMDWL